MTLPMSSADKTAGPAMSSTPPCFPLGGSKDSSCSPQSRVAIRDDDFFIAVVILVMVFQGAMPVFSFFRVALAAINGLSAPAHRGDLSWWSTSRSREVLITDLVVCASSR